MIQYVFVLYDVFDTTLTMALEYIREKSGVMRGPLILFGSLNDGKLKVLEKKYYLALEF